MQRRVRWMAVWLLVPLRAGTAQDASAAFRVGVSIGSVSYAGATRTVENRPDDPTARPHHPTMWGLTVSRGARGARLQASLAWGQAGLAVRGNPEATEDGSGSALQIVVDNVFRVTAISAGISAPLKRFSAGPVLRPSLGLLLERWASPGAPTQSLLGAESGLALEVPLSRSFSGVFGVVVGYTPGSPFREEGVPEGFITRSTWRRTLSGGVMLRL